MEAESAPLTFESTRLTSRGRIRLAVRADGKIVFVETFNVAQESARKRVAKSIVEHCPGVSIETATSELDRIAAEVADTPFKHQTAALAGCYRSEPSGIWWDKPCADGSVPIQLTNFVARISTMVVRDDGCTQQRQFEIEAVVGGRNVSLAVPTSTFASLNWVLEHLGSTALVFPGYDIKDNTRAALQLLSGQPPTETVYTHTGWRKIDPHGYCFLHAGGAIGPLGPVSDIEVDLLRELQVLALPAPVTGAELVTAVRASIALLDIAPPTVAFPCLAAAYRVVIDDMNLGVHLAGKTGGFKSEFAALVQGHFGEGIDANKLPGSWSSTGNANEALTFHAKDTLVVIDDFAPAGAGLDIQRQHRDADRLFRALGNRRGRMRLTADARFRTTYFPRGTILSTGEDIPSGHSINARVVIAELRVGDIAPADLTQAQAASAAGQYARAMASFIQALAGRLDEIRAKVRARTLELRGGMKSEGLHKRLPTNVAELQAGFEVFLTFAEVSGAIDRARHDELRDRCWTALIKSAETQSQHLATLDPVDAFGRLLLAALTAGGAHIAAADGYAPDLDQRSALGWAPDRADATPEWRPRGDLVGWIRGDDLFLEPTAAHRAAQRMAGDTDRLAIGVTTLGKRLGERGLLLTKDDARGRNLARPTLAGARRSVWHVGASILGLGAQPAQSGEDGLETDEPSSPPGKAARSTAVDGPVGPVSGTGDIASSENPHQSGPAADDSVPRDLPPEPGLDTAEVGVAPPPPTEPCWRCSRTIYWRWSYGVTWVCEACNPAASPDVVRYSLDGGAR